MDDNRIPLMAEYPLAGQCFCMRTRISLLVVVAVLVAVGLSAIGRGGSPTRDIVETIEASSYEWQRETLYLVLSQTRFPPPILRGQFGANDYANGRRLRILVLGDSYTYGWALADPDARWPVRLELEIEAELGPGTVEVVSMAVPGASTYLQAEWIEDLIDGRDLSLHGVATEDRGRLDGVFDAVVIGFVNNDRVAPVPMDDETYRGVIEYTKVNPNQQELESALATIHRYAGNSQLLWAPLEAQYLANQNYATVNERNGELFAGAGFTKIPMVETTEVAKTYPMKKLLVTVSDEHPGERLTSAYARDTAAELLRKLPARRIAEAREDGRGVTRPIVSGVLPAWAKFGDGGEKYLISFDSSAFLAQECRPLDLRGDVELRCEEDGPVMYIDGMAHPNQAGPCQLLSRPYIHIQADAFHRGGPHSLRIEGGRAKDFVVYRYGYDTDGFVKTEILGNADERDTWPIGDEPNGYALLLASRHVVGCASDSSYIDLFDGVQISIEKAKR